MIFGRIICYFYGHKRGRKVLSFIDGQPNTVVRHSHSGDGSDPVQVLPGEALFLCPRCGVQWTRKVSQRKQRRPTGTATKESTNA